MYFPVTLIVHILPFFRLKSRFLWTTAKNFWLVYAVQKIPTLTKELCKSYVHQILWRYSSRPPLVGWRKSVRNWHVDIFHGSRTCVTVMVYSLQQWICDGALLPSPQTKLRSLIYVYEKSTDPICLLGSLGRFVVKYVINLRLLLIYAGGVVFSHVNQSKWN